jgi:multimeric flavodoxin WrbA
MKRILVAYHSQEKGNTKAMAELVAQGCRAVAGVQVELVNVFERRVDMDVAAACDGYALGSPDYFTYMAGGLKQFFDDLCLADWAGKQVTGKPCVAFLTHGGGGGGIKSIESMAKNLKLTQVAPSVTCNGAPSGEAVQKSIELGTLLAKAVAAK